MGFLNKTNNNNSVRAEISADNEVEKIDMNSEKTDGPKRETPSLVSRCLPFILDENGVNVTENIPPAYTLDSVDDIIKSFEEKADEAISGLYSDKPASRAKEVSVNVNISKSEGTASGADLLRELERKMNEARSVSAPVKEKKAAAPETNEIKTYQSSIDDTRIVSGKNFGTKKINAVEATRQFTAIDPKRNSPKRDNKDISATQVINDVPHAEKKFAPLSREQSDVYDDFIDDMNGYTNVGDAKKFGNEYIAKKRGAMIKFVLTLILTVALGILNLPFFDSFWLNYTVAASSVSLGLLAVVLALNIRIFKGFGFLFGYSLSSELPYAILGSSVFIHSLTNIVGSSTASAPNFNLVAAIAISVSALSEFLRSAYTLDNFKRIANSKKKCAFSLIKESDAVSIAGDAVDGDVLIGAGKSCTNILGFVRSSESFDAAAKVVSIASLISLIASLVIGIMTFILKDSSGVAFNYALSVICITCFPATMLVNILPMKKLSGYLRRYRAQVPGYVNAGRIEQINTLALDSDMLFPEGSIELLNMKVIGNTSIDHILIDSAALTTAIRSPLAPIFTDIAGTRENAEGLPKADSVKYEEKMGISGWVGNRHLFIGNRTLLEAHGMSAAPIEVDRKILKSGAFPVYIAADGHTEVMLIVRYNAKAKIKYELARACNTGLTLVINNSDPNITNDMICDYFEIFDELVKVMPSKSAAVYHKCTCYEESSFANASFLGDIGGFLSIATSCIRLKTSLVLLLVSALVLQFGALAAAVYLMFAGSGVSVGMICFYQLIGSLLTFIISAIYKP